MQARILGQGDNSNTQRIEIAQGDATAPKRSLGVRDEAKTQKLTIGGEKPPEATPWQKRLNKAWEITANGGTTSGLIPNATFWRRQTRQYVLANSGHGHAFMRVAKVSAGDAGHIVGKAFTGAVNVGKMAMGIPLKEADAVKQYKVQQEKGYSRVKISSVEAHRPLLDLTFKKGTFSEINTKFDYRAIEKIELIRPGTTPGYKLLNPLEEFYRLQTKTHSPANAYIVGDVFKSLNGKEVELEVHKPRRWRRASYTVPYDLDGGGIAYRKAPTFPKLREAFGPKIPVAIEVQAGDILPKGYDKVYPRDVFPRIGSDNVGGSFASSGGTSSKRGLPAFVKSTTSSSAVAGSPTAGSPSVIDIKPGTFVGQGGTIRATPEGLAAGNGRTSIPALLGEDGAFPLPETSVKTDSIRTRTWNWGAHKEVQAWAAKSKTVRGLGVIGAAVAAYGTLSTSSSEAEALTKGSATYNRHKRGFVINVDNVLPDAVFGTGWNLGVGRETTKTVAGMAAGIAVSHGAGMVGAAIGTFLLPGVGTYVGYFAGQFIAGAATYYLASEAADKAWTWRYGEKA